MGDVRYDEHYRRVVEAADRAAALRHLADDEVIQALAAASRNRDALLANVLATEAMNRMRRSRLITEHLAEGAFSVDGKCRFTFVNPALGKRLAVEWQEAIGRTCTDVMRLLEDDGREIPPDASPVKRAMQSGETVEWVGRVRGAEGDPFPAVLTVSPVHREGEVEGAVATLRDITQRRRLLARYESLFHHMREPTFFLDEGGALLDLNPAAADVLRAPIPQLRGEHFSRLLAPEDLERATLSFASVLSGERRVDEYTVVRPDGSRVRLRITGVPMYDADGIVGMHGLGEVVRELGNGE